MSVGDDFLLMLIKQKHRELGGALLLQILNVYLNGSRKCRRAK